MDDFKIFNIQQEIELECLYKHVICPTSRIPIQKI